MNAGGETADQVVRMTLQGIEVAANVALKAGGMASKSLAVTLYAILTDKKKVKGKARLNSMLKSGKELKVFAIRHEDLKLFMEEAKHYGVLYTVLKSKNDVNGICDIMVRAEDASKISRIIDKFELATIDTEAIRKSVMAQQSAKDSSLTDVPILSDDEHDALVDSLMNSVKENDKSIAENPTIARTSKESQSEHTSRQTRKDITEQERTSVRNELKEIKEEQRQRIKKKQTVKQRQSRASHHKQTDKKKKRNFKKKER